MRIIGGEFRSRRLKTVPGMQTRPTPDRLRETLFDIVMQRLEGATFLDGYAGTGAVGIEALSRGAREAIFIERNHAAVEIIRQNLHALGLEERAQVITGKTSAVLARLSADIVFLDPPYDMPNEYGAALSVLGENAPPLAIVQHSSHQPLGHAYGGLARYRTVRQGDNVLSFYHRNTETQT